MKPLLYAVAIMAIMLFASSCEETIRDGAWDPIELDKSHVNFPQEGGQNTVSALNYTRWWISGAYDLDKGLGDNYEFYIYPTSSGGEETCTYDILDGGWFHIIVPDKGKSNTVIITVDAHDNTTPRQAVVQMQCGNAFTKFSISQQ